MELQSTYDRIDDDHAALGITIPANDVNTLIDQFIIALAYQSNITPKEGQELEEAAAQKLGKDVVENHLTTSVMSYSFPFAAEGNGIQIVGKPSFVWMSLDKDKSFPANIRWNRIFSKVK